MFRTVGKRDPHGSRGIVPLDWVKQKFNSGKKEKKEGDNVIR